MYPEKLTMRKAVKIVAKGDGFIVWHLECAATSHRLPGLAYTSKEAAMADPRRDERPEYLPVPYLKRRAVERRWEVGQGRAGGDVRRAYPFYVITPIQGAL